MPVTSPPRVAIYNRVFLNYSQTFIYRQLLGVRHVFAPLVFTRRQLNRDQFEYQPLYICAGGVVNHWSARMLARFGIFRLRAEQQRYFREVAQSENVALIHAHFGPSGLEMLPVAQALEIPLLVTFHGFDASTLLHRRAYRRNLSQLFDYAYSITVSDFMAQRLLSLGADPKRLARHYIGVPVEKFDFVKRQPIASKRRAGERIEFLQVSGFVPKKGHRYTLSAFQRFLQSYPNTRLTFAGSGPQEAAIKQQCQDLGMTDSVRFLGRVSADRVAQLMGDADVFLHLSITSDRGDEEGIPTVIMEAMATGLTCISTFHAGIPELIQDGINGYLVPERDVQAYTDAMLAAVESAADLGTAARQRVITDFNLGTQNARLANLYQRALSQRWGVYS